MDKEEKLRYTLFELNGHLVFSIFYMDERFRSQDSDLKLFIASNGWKVCSSQCPEIDLTGKIIYLLGRSFEHDKKVYIEELNERKIIINQIHFALKEWAEKWEGWRNSPTKSPFKSDYPIFSC